MMKSACSHRHRASWRSQLAVESLENRSLPNGTAFNFALELGGSSSAVTDTTTANDSSGDIYVTGNFKGTVNFDTTHTLMDSGSGKNAFVAKYSSNGALLWADELGTGSTETGSTGASGYRMAIAVDGDGNVYTTGGFTGTGSFSGTGTGDDLTSVTNDNSTNAYVSKLSSTGAYIWADVLGDGSNSGYVGGQTITVDASGNVYTTGFLEGTGSFSGTGSGDNLTGNESGNSYIIKLSSADAYIWSVVIGKGSDCYTSGIAVDTAGNVYTAGGFYGTGSFSGTGGGDDLTSTGNGAAYVLKLSSTGAFGWVDIFNSGGYVSETIIPLTLVSLAMDGSGNVYITGTFTGTASFSGTDSGDTLSTTSGDYNAYAVKLNSSGTYIWDRDFGYGGDAESTAIALDGSSDVYIVGYFNGTSSFPGNGSGVSLTSAGGDNAFVVKLNPTSNFLWADDLGKDSSTVAYGVAVDGSGNVDITGDFAGTGAFSGTGSDNTLTSVGTTDGFITQLKQLGAVVTSSTSNLPINSGTITITGVGFDPTGTNTIVLSSGVGTVTGVAATTITITLSSAPTGGPLTIIVITDGVSSGTPVQIATVHPAVTLTTTTLPANTNTLTVIGIGFDPTGTNTITLSSGVGTVTAVTSTSITITFSTAPTAGTLIIIVITDGASSGTPVEVAKILPVVTQSTSSLPANSTTLTINGVGFDPSGTNTITLSSGSGTVTAVSATSLTITFRTAPTAGTLTLIVITDGVSSGTPVQVATVDPVVTLSASISR